MLTSSSRPIGVLLLGFLLSFAAGCRSGDTVVCEQAATCGDGTRSVAEAVFSNEGGNTCESAVDDLSCGVDAESLQRCINDLAEPLCYDPQTQDFKAVVAQSPCVELARTLARCVAEAEARASSGDDDDD